MTTPGIIIAAVVGFILGVFASAGLSNLIDHRSVSAGVMIVGSKAYRVTPIEPVSRP